MKRQRTHHTPYTNREVVTEDKAWQSGETIRTALGDVEGAPASKRRAAKRSAHTFADTTGSQAFAGTEPASRTPIRTIEEIFGTGTAEENTHLAQERLARLELVAPVAGGVVGEVTHINVNAPTDQAFHPEVHVVEHEPAKAS